MLNNVFAIDGWTAKATQRSLDREAYTAKISNVITQNADKPSMCHRSRNEFQRNKSKSRRHYNYTNYWVTLKNTTH